MHPALLAYRTYSPCASKECFIAPTAIVIGDVAIGKESSIWFHCVIRGDVQSITIGERTNIQDGTVIHVTRGDGPTYIGNEVTIGHKALLHACTVEDQSFIGMGAIIMDKAIIETGAMVAAGALVPPGKRVLSGQIWAGNPARYLRDMTVQERDHIKISANNYVLLAREYEKQLFSS